MHNDNETTPTMQRLIATVLRLFAATGLGIDAAVHANLAPIYDGVRATVSEGDLFRIEAAVACLVALVLLVSGRRIVVAAALLVAASAVVALFVSRYVDLGRLGPIPNLYEPAWYPQKTAALVAELVTVASAGVLLVLPGIAVLRRRSSRLAELVLVAGAALGAITLVASAAPTAVVSRTPVGRGVQRVTIVGNNLLRFTPSIVHLHPGAVRITLEDMGAYPHNLQIPALHVTSPSVTGDPGGTVVTFTVDFPAKGQYHFDCVYHASAGMLGTFVVS